ncbi:MAG: fibronectin type III domain-containing protein, partial [Actinobacteria bacterium]|nr:fibronectin type III domain-containing protein [Actinomycetota bacterium]
MIVSSTNGGATWSRDSLPRALIGSGSTGTLLSDVSCASARFCMVGGSREVRTAGGEGALVVVSTDGGASWLLRPQTSALGSFSSLACPGVEICLATGAGRGTNRFGSAPYVIVATTSGGAAWRVQAESGSPETIACSSTSDCTALGATVSATTDGGASWRRVGNGIAALPGYSPSGQGASSLSCPSASFCVAGLANGLAVTTDGGSSWTLPALAPQVSSVTSVSCASASACTATGSAGMGAALLGSTDGGSTWSIEDAASSTYGLTGASCASASACMVVGGSTVEGTSDGGASWNAVALPSGQAAGHVYFRAVSCGSASSCVAVGGTEPSAQVPGSTAVVDVGSPAGTVLRSLPVPGGAVTLWAVSCAGAGTCVALGQSLDGAPVVVVSADGGLSWSSVAVPAGVVQVVSVSCASAADCVLVADAVRSPSKYYYFGKPGIVLASTDGGVAWVRRGLLALPGGTSGKGGGSLDPTSVSCGTPEDCVATGFNGPGVLYSTDGGATWLAGSVTHGSNGELGLLSGIAGNATVSCSGPADCVMAEVFGVLLRSTDGGATWDVETALPLGSLAPTFNGYSGIGSSPIGLSCATGSACVLAAGVAAYTTTDGGVGAPSAPNDVHAVGAPGAAVVTWAPPLIDGGAPASSYVVVASPGGSSFTVPASATEAVVTGLSDGKSYTFTVQAVNVAGAGPASSASNPAVPSPAGYWSVGADGGIYAFGSASFAGSLPGDHVVPNAPIVGVAPTPDGGGYWLADAKGGVYAFGDAKFLGSLPGDKLAPFGSIVGIVAAPGGSGYWLVSSEGFVYAFGDAVFVGPTVPSKDGITS